MREREGESAREGGSRMEDLGGGSEGEGEREREREEERKKQKQKLMEDNLQKCKMV